MISTTKSGASTHVSNTRAHLHPPPTRTYTRPPTSLNTRHEQGTRLTPKRIISSSAGPTGQGARRHPRTTDLAEEVAEGGGGEGRRREGHRGRGVGGGRWRGGLGGGGRHERGGHGGGGDELHPEAGHLRRRRRRVGSSGWLLGLPEISLGEFKL
ncbi:hypothetical protein SEVIR_2G375066v4 [Setaria viridis]